MRIVETTRDRLVIEDCPWAFGLGTIATVVFCFWVALAEGIGGGRPVLAVLTLLVAAGGVAALILGVRRVRLSVDREAGAELLVRDWWGLRRRHWPAGIDVRAALATNRSGEGETYRAILLVGDPPERVPLTVYASSADIHEKAVEAIMALRRSA